MVTTEHQQEVIYDLSNAVIWPLTKVSRWCYL